MSQDQSPVSVFRSVNPATGLAIADYPLLSNDQIDAKLEAAARAAPAWRQMPLAERSAILARMAELATHAMGDLSRLIVEEMGKPLSAAAGEVEKCAYTLRHYAENAGTLLAAQPAMMPGARQASVRLLPIGTILAIMPWNFPLFQVVRFLAPTLVAGNVALLKPAEHVAGSALALEEIGRKAGLPEGVFQTLIIDVPSVARVIADPRVQGVTLTGSERAGRSVAAEAGKVLKKCVLELGGSDPLIVMPSADVEAAAEAAIRSRMMNNGQSCICAKRFIVADEVYDAFVAAAVARTKALRIGDPMHAETQIGPLVSARARDMLDAQVQAARAAGGRILTGGRRIDGDGFFYEPTLIADIPAGAPIRKEEFFGPVAMILRASDRHEALALANETPFGLGSSVWTADDDEAAFFADGIEAGMTFVNSIVASDPHIPFGGIKNSGFGREFGTYGLHEFLNVKTVVAA